MLIQKILHLALEIPSKRKAGFISASENPFFWNLNLHTMLDRIPFHILHDTASSQQKLVKFPHPLVTTLKRQRPSGLRPGIPVWKPITFYLSRGHLLIRQLSSPFSPFYESLLSASNSIISSLIFPSSAFFLCESLLCVPGLNSCQLTLQCSEHPEKTPLFAAGLGCKNWALKALLEPLWRSDLEAGTLRWSFADPHPLLWWLLPKYISQNSRLPSTTVSEGSR